MEKRIQAVYRDGVLQPLEALALQKHQQVTLTITDAENVPQANCYFSAEEWEQALHDDVSLDAVRQALATIESPLSDAVIASREER